jgi:phosphoesterase RecJ-like protein
MVFWSRRKESAILSGICMARCKFLKNGRISWSIIRKKDFVVSKGKSEDVDSVADQIRSIQGVEIVVFFREESMGMLRVSLRSKGKINVASIAEYYNGGGHFDVAGCSIPDNAESRKKLLAMAIRLLR